jgi:kynurenine formamidase
LSPQLAEVLVKRGVKAVGIDTLSPDAGDAVYPHVHMTLLSRNILIIENLGDLSPMPPAGAVVIALPMNVRGGTGSPARVLAFVERNRDVGIPGG